MTRAGQSDPPRSRESVVGSERARDPHSAVGSFQWRIWTLTEVISLPFFFFSLRLLGSQGGGSLSLGATSSDDGRRTGEPSRVGTDLPAPPGCAGPQLPLRLRRTWSAWRDLRPKSPPLCAVTMNESANRVTSRRASKALRQAEDSGRHVPPHGSAHAKCPDARCVATGGRFVASGGGGRREWVGVFFGG